MSSQYKKLIGITIDYWLIVDIHNKVCKKVGRKLQTAAIVTPYMSLSHFTKNEVSIKDFFSKYEKIRSLL